MTIAENVIRGAEWLDKEFPDWENKIDLDSLYLRNPCQCILGQLFREKIIRNDPHMRADTGYMWAVIYILQPRGMYPRKYGFTHSELNGWDELDKEWRTQIEKRRADKGTMI